MTKITRFRDVPAFIQSGGYEVDQSPDYLISWIDREIAESGFQTDPDFQRGHVWTDKQRRAFIEYFLRGGKTARVLYFNNPSGHKQATTAYNDFVLIDGKQRLEAWRKFLGNRLRVFGSYFKQYSDELRVIQTMRVNVNDLQTRAEVLSFYLQYNQSGVVHSEEEIKRVKALLRKERKT